MLAPWKKNYDKPRQHNKKQRHYFAKKGPSSQSYGFSSSHVWMWERTIKKVECWRMDAFELWCWRRFLRVLWTAWRSLQEISEVKWRSEVKWSEFAQSCATSYDPMDCSLPGSSAHGIFQTIVLEWTAILFSRGSSQPRDRTRVSRTVDRRFTVWATREVHPCKRSVLNIHWKDWCWSWNSNTLATWCEDLTH